MLEDRLKDLAAYYKDRHDVTMELVLLGGAVGIRFIRSDRQKAFVTLFEISNHSQLGVLLDTIDRKMKNNGD